MEESDEDLVAHSQQGSIHAFESLVRRYQPRVLHFLEKQLNNRQDAEDVTQKTFIHAHASLSRFITGHRFAPWLFTIARRQGIDAMRQSGSRRRLAEKLLSEPPTEAATDPSGLLGQQESVEEIWRWIWSQLDPRSCEILWLRIQEEMDLPEIAKVMEISHSHTKVLLHRARKSLNKSLFPSSLGSPYHRTAIVASPDTDAQSLSN